MAAHAQIVKAISELEARPIRTRRDITCMEGEAKTLLTLKEMATSRPKSYYYHEFQNAVLSILELQKEFRTTSDHIRASQTFVELRKRMRRLQDTRGQFFEKLYEVFPPTIGSSNNETGTDLVEVAYQASFPRDDAPRAGGRKENANPQFGKRKTTFDEPSVELKRLQDLKSENGNLHALLRSIVDHFGINSGRKRKGQGDVNKPAKSHAALAIRMDRKASPRNRPGRLLFQCQDTTLPARISPNRNHRATSLQSTMRCSLESKWIPCLSFQFRISLGPNPALHWTRPRLGQGGTRIILATTTHAPGSLMTQRFTVSKQSKTR